MKKFLLITVTIFILLAAGCSAGPDNAAVKAYAAPEEKPGEQPLPPETTISYAGCIDINDTSSIEVRFHYPEDLVPVPVSKDDGDKIAELLNGHELIGEWPALEPDPQTMLSLYADGQEYRIETTDDGVILTDDGSAILNGGVITSLMKILDNYR